MRIRLVKEVQQEIEEAYQWYKDTHHTDIDTRNFIGRRIRNLKLELNRARLKEWDDRRDDVAI